MAKTIDHVFYYATNSIRILVGLFFLLFFLSELYDIAVNAETYEKVYTGVFLGENRYESLFLLKKTIWIYNFITTIYLLLIILHLTKFKRSKPLTWFLRIIDVFIIIRIGYSLYKIFC